MKVVPMHVLAASGFPTIIDKLLFDSLYVINSAYDVTSLKIPT